MNKFVKFKLFGLLIFLSAALAFVGINLLDAQVEITGKGPKKPKEAEWNWKVLIPGVLSGNNLYRYYPSQGGIYEDKGAGDGIYVGVEKKGGGKRIETQFELAVFNNRGEFGCHTDWQDGLGERKIGFQNIDIVTWWFADTAKDEYPCFFPTNFPYDCANDPANYLDKKPVCMANFLNGLQPYCDGPHPECSYDYVYIVITVDYDIEKIEGSVPTTGVVWVKVINTFDLQDGCQYPHNISGVLRRDVSEGHINIVRNGDDEWTITVDGTFTFTEIYKGTWKGKGKGKKGGWEYKIPYWAQIPLTFETTWTREQVK